MPVKALTAALFVSCIAFGSGADQFSVVINEINYHPLPAADTAPSRLEWIELYNRSAKRIDVTGWHFSAGARFTFPEQTAIPGKGYLVVARSLPAFSSIWDAVPCVGDLGSNLPNGRARITLRNSGGLVVDTVFYSGEPPWPEAAGGHGATLELVSPELDNDNVYNWSASRTLGGTPGQANSSLSEKLQLIPRGAVWRFWRGNQPPPGTEGDWTGTGYDDGMWETGESPLGFGGEEFCLTSLGDMNERYTSLFLRRAFEVDKPDLLESLRLSVDFDDGFIAYLNGKQVACCNMQAESFPAHTQTARSSHESGSPAEWPLESGLLQEGLNVLSVFAANRSLGSHDFLIEASLRAAKRPQAGLELPSVSVNEIGISGGESWVELFNPSGKPADMEGCRLGWSYSPLPLKPLSGIVEPGGFAVFPLEHIPFSGTMLVTYGPKNLLLSSLSYTVRPDESCGPVPGGGQEGRKLSEPTPGKPNAAPFCRPVIVSEINYHPQSEDRRDEFIELVHTGEHTVDLSAWKFTSGILFTFPSGFLLHPGEYIVVVPDKEYAISKYEQARVAGSYSKALSDRGERIRLEDAEGRTVVDFCYADDGAWPSQADGPSHRPDPENPEDTGGEGMSCELMHPDLDPSLGGSWIAETVGGTPGRPRENQAEDVPPVLSGVSFAPLLPKPGGGVHFTVKAECPDGVESVQLNWRYDQSAGQDFHSLSLLDDGLSGDGEAKDGLYGGFEVRFDKTGTVVFYLECKSSTGAATLWPRGAPDKKFMLRVDSRNFPPVDSKDFYYLIMTRHDLLDQSEGLRERGDRSNLLLPCALLKGGKIYQYAMVRYRGASARRHVPHSYRVELSHYETNPWHHILYLNALHPHNQHIGMAMFRRAGLPAPRTKFISLGMGDGFWTGYIQVERMDSRFLEFQFPGESDGNLYQGCRANGPAGSDAPLEYWGEDPGNYMRGYTKENNQGETGWSDIIQLCRSLNIRDETYLSEVEKIVDIDQWARFFAVQTVIANEETCIYNEAGDDYFLYARETDGRFILIPWDMDTVFGNTDHPLFRPELSSVRRFIRHPAIAPRYWYHLDRLLDRTFTLQALEREFTCIDGSISADHLASFRSFLKDRSDFIRKRLPGELSVCTSVTEDASPLIDLIPSGSQWRYFKGRSAPSAELLWTEPGFDDSGWEKGPAGLGYERKDDYDPFIATELNDMYKDYTTLYIRGRFEVEVLEDLLNYELRVDSDDGFVCYLNGQEVARERVDNPGSIVNHNETADHNHEADSPDVYPMDSWLQYAQQGENVIAFVALNVHDDSSDFLINPVLVPRERNLRGRPGGCGSPVYAAPECDLVLRGTAPVIAASTVEVSAGESTYDGSYNVLTGRWELPLLEVPEELTINARNFAGEVVDSFTVDILPTPPQEIAGAITSDRTLTSQSGPFLMDSVTVEAGSVLTIEQGCELLFSPDKTFTVQGELRLLGSENQPVVVRGGPQAVAAQIRIQGGKATFEHIDFEGGSAAPEAADPLSALNLHGGELLLKNSAFEGYSSYCVAADSGYLQVDGCSFEHCEGGIRLEGADAEVTDTRFLSPGPEHGISHTSGTLTVEGCVFRNMERRGLFSTSRSQLTENSFINAGESALAFAGGAESTVESTLIAGSECGISLRSTGKVDLKHLTMAGNDLALDLASGGTEGGNITVKDSIIWDNYRMLALQGRSQLEVSFSLLQEKDMAALETNFCADPEFVDPANENWSLSAGSPALQRGSEGTDLGAFQRHGNPIVPGDINGDGDVNIADVSAQLSYLFAGGNPPACIALIDTNGDERMDVSDSICLLLYLFGGGPQPADPSDRCGKLRQPAEFR